MKKLWKHCLLIVVGVQMNPREILNEIKNDFQVVYDES